VVTITKVALFRARWVSTNFFYDSLNRITQAYTTAPNWGDAFTIDAWGNLTNKASVTGKTSSARKTLFEGF